MKCLPKLNAGELTKVMDMCTTFFLDASVLILVFPVLDTFVQHGRKGLTWGLFAGTFAISGLFFAMAVATLVLTARRKAEWRRLKS